MSRKVVDLHCGACMRDFDDMDTLTKHIETCQAARVLLLGMHKMWFGDNKPGHDLSHFIFNCHRNAHTIKRYAYSIADEIDNMGRSKIHSELCDRLELDYNKFKPFEADEIKTIPTRREAESILWSALRNEMALL